MKRIIFDIETTRCNLTDLQESQQEFYSVMQKKKYTNRSDRKGGRNRKNLSLFPFTAKVIAIAYYDVQNNKIYVMYENEIEEEKFEGESGIVYQRPS